MVATVGIAALLLTACTTATPPRLQPEMPDVAALAGSLADQQLAWEECDFAGSPFLVGADLSNLECATIQVPQDWTDPDPEVTWDLRISQATNVDPSAPEYDSTLMIHAGGPTTPGLPEAAIAQRDAPELRATTNFVSFDQRGIGQSSIVECEYEYDPTAGDLGVTKAIAEACSSDPEVRTITSEQTAHDMDFIRHLLGLDSVSYVGDSYGTWLGTWFGALFRDNIDRMVFDSAIDVTQRSIQYNMTSQHTAYDRQFRLHLLNWMARNDNTYGLGGDPEKIWSQYFDASSTPERGEAAQLLWYSTNAVVAFSKNVAYPVAADLVAQVIAEGETAPVAGEDATTIALRILDRLDPAVFTQPVIDAARAAISAPVPVDEPGTRTFNSTVDFIYCNDGEWVQGEDFWATYNESTAVEAPLTAQLGRLDVPPLCAWWPSEQEMPEVGEDFPETIVVQSEFDALTPLESGRATSAALRNAVLVVVDNEGAHGVFPYGTDDVDAPVFDFLLGEEPPITTVFAPAHPLPLETIVFESWAPLNEFGLHDDEEPDFTDPGAVADADDTR